MRASSTRSGTPGNASRAGALEANANRRPGAWCTYSGRHPMMSRAQARVALRGSHTTYAKSPSSRAAHASPWRSQACAMSSASDACRPGAIPSECASAARSCRRASATTTQPVGAWR